MDDGAVKRRAMIDARIKRKIGQLGGGLGDLMIRGCPGDPAMIEILLSPRMALWLDRVVGDGASVVRFARRRALLTEEGARLATTAACWWQAVTGLGVTKGVVSVGSNDRDAAQILCGRSGAIAFGCSDAGERGYRGKDPASKPAFARVLENER